MAGVRAGMLACLAAIALAADSGDPDPVVRVATGSATCAGVIVAPGDRVLTAYHCVASGGRPRVHTRDGRHVVGRVRAWDVGADLAVIEAPGLPGGLDVAAGPPAPGTPIHVYGHPLGADLPSGWYEGLLRWSVSTGVISGVGTRAVQIDAPINPGNSGGPVVGPDGKVVSVVSRRLGGQGLGFGARTESLGAVLAEAPRRPGLGGTFELGGSVAALQAFDGAVATGPAAALVLRDRVVIGGAARFPFAPAVTASRFGSAAYPVAEARAGLRQRVGVGPWALRFDVHGGIAGIAQWTGEVAGDRIDVRAATTTAWLVGGAIASHGVSLEVGALPQGRWIAGIGLQWPGTVAVF